MITHDVDEAILLADRILLMSNGPHARDRRDRRNTLPRERTRLTIHHDPQYYRIRNHLVDFLVHRSKLIQQGAEADACRDADEPARGAPGLEGRRPKRCRSARSQARYRSTETTPPQGEGKGMNRNDVTEGSSSQGQEGHQVGRRGQKVGLSKEWVTAGCLGQMTFTAKQAATLVGKIFGLDAGRGRAGCRWCRTRARCRPRCRPTR
jgi:hypothetical protein